MGVNEKIHGIPARIAALQAKLKARKGVPGYQKNCEEIEAEIARLESLTQAPDAGERVASE